MGRELLRVFRVSGVVPGIVGDPPLRWVDVDIEEV